MKPRKRFIPLLLCALFLLLSFSACAPQETGPLRICVDLGLNNAADTLKVGYEFESLLKVIAEKGGPAVEDMEVEIVPANGEERKGALTRLHTEIMGGKGPDLFIIGFGWQDDLLFPYPEKSARNGIFLNLDKLMEKSQFTQWDQQVQPILDAGKTEKGQYLIPLSYQFNMTCFLKEDVSHTPDTGVSWEDMAASADIIDQACLNYWGGPSQKMQSTGDCTVHYTLGKLADYDNEELLFTADELRERLTRNFELMDAGDQGYFDQLPIYYQPLAGPGFNSNASSVNIHNEIISQDAPLTLLPLYTKGGGVAAAVRSYAAINASSKRQEDAFFILDYLMSQESQQGTGFYNTRLAGCGTFQGFPMDARLMSEEYPVHYSGGGAEWSLTPENFESFCAVRDAITSVNFFDTVTKGVYDLEQECYQIHSGYQEGDIDSIIDETVRVLSMSIQES